jgi:hypothetical protein
MNMLPCKGMNEPNLTKEQEQALNAQNGFVQGTSYVLMAVDMYNKVLGVDDTELTAALADITSSLEDIEAGETLSMNEAKVKLDQKYGV